jgi:hypothetical protein
MKLLVNLSKTCGAVSSMLVGYPGSSCLVVKNVGLMSGVSSTVLGVLTIVGEYTVDSIENDLAAP